MALTLRVCGRDGDGCRVCGGFWRLPNTATLTNYVLDDGCETLWKKSQAARERLCEIAGNCYSERKVGSVGVGMDSDS